MCKVISIVNQKGGVAKTTTTNALGLGLAMQGHRVLLIDLDPQGNLSMSLGVTFPDVVEKSIAALMLTHLQNHAEHEYIEYINRQHGVDVFIGNDDLGKLERMLSGWRDSEFTLQTILQDLRDQYEYIIIDCMPSVGNLTENAIIAADEIIIPSEPQFFSTKGIQSLFDEISKIKRRKNPSLNVVGILPTKVDTRTNIAKGFLQTISDIFGEDMYIFRSMIPISTRLAECNDGKNLYEYDPNGKGVQAYFNFVNEYLVLGEEEDVKQI